MPSSSNGKKGATYADRRQAGMWPMSVEFPDDIRTDLAKLAGGQQRSMAAEVRLATVDRIRLVQAGYSSVAQLLAHNEHLETEVSQLRTRIAWPELD